QPGAGDEHFREMTLFVVLHQEVCRALLERRMGAIRTARLIDALSAIVLFQHHLDEALALARPDRLGAPELRELLARAWPRALEIARRDDVRLPVVGRFKN